MENNEVQKCEKKCCEVAHVCLKVTKVLLQAATVAAAFCVVKELHRIHKAVENHHHDHHKLL